MATWNVTGLGDHIPEIVDIMKKRKIGRRGKLPCYEFRTAERKDLDQNRMTATLCIRGVEETHMQIMESAS